MNQAEINKEWFQTLPANVGEITMLVQPRHTTPGLRHPYEWALPMDQLDSLILAMRGLFNKHCESVCSLVEVKGLAYGKRLHIWCLAHKLGLCGDPTVGITEEDWNTLGERVRFHLQVLPDAKPYIEPWNPDEKFEIRFEAYIAYKELTNQP